MTVINLTCGRSTWPVRDPIVEGYRQLFAAVLVRAARDVTLCSDPDSAADAREFLAELEADCADLVKLRPPSHRSAQPEKTPGPAWAEDWRGPISRNVRSKAWRGMVRL